MDFVSWVAKKRLETSILTCSLCKMFAVGRNNDRTKEHPSFVYSRRLRFQGYHLASILSVLRRAKVYASHTCDYQVLEFRLSGRD